MDRDERALGDLTRRERRALRALLIRATAEQRPRDRDELERLVRAAPIAALPAATTLHRVTGSVRRALNGVDGVPGDVIARLSAITGRSAIRHLFVVGALSEIGRAFDEAELAWVAIKGPVAAALLYPEAGDRAYRDLDLLVSRRQFGDAVARLEVLGYRPTVKNWVLAESMLAGQVTMSGPLLDVDLHWHLHYSRTDRRPFAIDPEVMLGRGRRVEVSGVTVPTLDPVDTLLVLAFHAARSGGGALVWLKDVERAVHVERPDLDELVRRCHAFRCAPPVGLVMGRARALLDAEIPEPIVHALAPAPLRAADRVVSACSPPAQLHRGATALGVFTRSARRTTLSSVSAVPGRAVRSLRQNLRPPAEHETDDPGEKATYLRAVAASDER